jgi:hypothetical protein
MTTATSPKCLLSDLMQEVGPKDVTEDEAAAMLGILQQAWNRKHGAVFDGDVIDLNLVRRHPRWRR